MATLRNLAISLHRLAGATNIAAALRHHARDAPDHSNYSRSSDFADALGEAEVVEVQLVSAGLAELGDVGADVGDRVRGHRGDVAADGDPLGQLRPRRGDRVDDAWPGAQFCSTTASTSSAAVGVSPGSAPVTQGSGAPCRTMRCPARSGRARRPAGRRRPAAGWRAGHRSNASGRSSAVRLRSPVSISLRTSARSVGPHGSGVVPGLDPPGRARVAAADRQQPRRRGRPDAVGLLVLVLVHHAERAAGLQDHRGELQPAQALRGQVGGVGAHGLLRRAQRPRVGLAEAVAHGELGDGRCRAASCGSARSRPRPGCRRCSGAAPRRRRCPARPPSPARPGSAPARPTPRRAPAGRAPRAAR